MTLNTNIKAAPLGEAGKGFAAGAPFEIIADFGFVLPKRQGTALDRTCPVAAQ